MTPRQVFAWFALAQARLRRAHAADLAIAALGARGDKDAVEAQLRAWRD